MYSFLRCEYVHTLVTLARPFISLACPPPSSPDYERKRFSSFFCLSFSLVFEAYFSPAGARSPCKFFPQRQKQHRTVFTFARTRRAHEELLLERERVGATKKHHVCAATAVSSLANACASSSSSKINSTNPTSRKNATTTTRCASSTCRVSRCSSSKKDNGHRRSGGGSSSSGSAVSTDRPG